MKKYLSILFSITIIFSVFLAHPLISHAQDAASAPSTQQPGFESITAGCLALSLTGYSGDPGDLGANTPQNLIKYKCGSADENGNMAGLIPKGASYVAQLYQIQPSGQEYVADLLNNIGLPTVSPALAQGTGYTAMSSFLTYWKVFRNLAYTLYIIMFIVVGIMIMLRTKVNAQTIITIQSALPNLLITLLLITFSYAIVGFMIDIMYFLIYFVVFIFSSIHVLDGPKTITRLMSHSAWGVLFADRSSIISLIARTMRDIIGSSSGAGIVGRVVAGVTTFGVSELMVQGIPYLLAAVWLTLTMLKLIFVLTKSYIMLIVQTVTAPVQILMNAVPGSKAFSEWLKKTASYLIPFPIAAAMFIVAAIFIGNPTNDNTLLGFIEKGTGADTNPFGVTSTISQDKLWAPPFTIDFGWQSSDIMVLLGFFIFAMTPAAVKMAQDWLQVKESPYAAEAFGGLGMAYGGYEWLEKQKQKRQSEKMYQKQLEYYSGKAGQV